MENVGQRVALITGANKGIGFEIARAVGLAGHLVLVGARNAALGAAAVERLTGEGIAAELCPIDVADGATIDGAANVIGERFGRLDVLVNNAGIMDQVTDGHPSVADLDTVEHILKVNFLGTVAVTQALLPLVRRSAAGRIVNVSSHLGSMQLSGDLSFPSANTKLLGYSASKAAMNMFTVQLAWELRETTIKVNAAAPGYTKTDLNGNKGGQTVAEGAAAAIRLALLPEDGPTGGFFSAKGVEPW